MQLINDDDDGNNYKDNNNNYYYNQLESMYIATCCSCMLQKHSKLLNSSRRYESHDISLNELKLH